MSLCKPLTQSPAQIEANRRDSKSTNDPRLSAVSNALLPLDGSIRDRRFPFFDVRSRNVYENKQYEDKV